LGDAADQSLNEALLQTEKVADLAKDLPGLDWFL